jgi:hypothetical protein
MESSIRPGLLFNPYRVTGLDAAVTLAGPGLAPAALLLSLPELDGLDRCLRVHGRAVLVTSRSSGYCLRVCCPLLLLTLPYFNGLAVANDCLGTVRKQAAQLGCACNCIRDFSCLKGGCYCQSIVEISHQSRPIRSLWLIYRLHVCFLLLLHRACHVLLLSCLRIPIGRATLPTHHYLPSYPSLDPRSLRPCHNRRFRRSIRTSHSLRQAQPAFLKPNQRSNALMLTSKN